MSSKENAAVAELGLQSEVASQVPQAPAVRHHQADLSEEHVTELTVWLDDLETEVDPNQIRFHLEKLFHKKFRCHFENSDLLQNLILHRSLMNKLKQIIIIVNRFHHRMRVYTFTQKKSFLSIVSHKMAVNNLSLT